MESSKSFYTINRTLVNSLTQNLTQKLTKHQLLLYVLKVNIFKMRLKHNTMYIYEKWKVHVYTKKMLSIIFLWKIRKALMRKSNKTAKIIITVPMVWNTSLLNILILHILIYRFKAIPLRITLRFSVVIDKYSKSYMGK